MRFSTVAGNKGSADLARDVRGFAVKLYTKQGNWDIVGNNIPVFFIQDAIKFPDLIHAVKQEPDRGFPQAQTAHDNFWDFISLTPECMHMAMWIMSDRAIPRSFRFMEGFGVHTFRLINAEGKSTFVKFHWKPKLGLQSVVWNEAVKINGADPDFHRRDLWNAIQMGDYPEWELGLQLFDEDFADTLRLRCARRYQAHSGGGGPGPSASAGWCSTAVSDNFFAETEQVAFCTQNIVPGIDFSQRSAAPGPQFLVPRYPAQTAWAAPTSPIFRSTRRNVRFTIFSKTATWPWTIPRPGQLRAQFLGRRDGGPRESPEKGFQFVSRSEEGPKLRVRSETFADHYSQARQFYLSQTEVEQKHIADALTFELSKVETRRSARVWSRI